MDVSLVTMELGNEGNTLAAVLSKNDEKTLITLFQLPNSIVEKTPPDDLYMGGAKEFSSNFIWKQEAVLTESALRLVLSSQSTMFTTLSNSFELAKFTLPPLKEKDMEWELSPDITLPAHDVGKIHLALSFHQKWIASAASDGKLFLRLVENPEKAVTCTPHHYQTSGCIALALSRDCQHVITVGDNGTITCWNWDFTSHGNIKAQLAKEYLGRVLHSLSSQHRCENSALEAMAPITDKTPSEGERTWHLASTERLMFAAAGGAQSP